MDDNQAMPKQPHVLLVDDDPTLLRALNRHLEQHQVTVEMCTDGESAIEKLGAHEFDVVVSDISMPRMSGLQLLRAVREKRRELPVVLMTGAPDMKSAIEALEYGAFKYLLKPVDTKELVDVVKRAAKLYQLARIKRDARGEMGIEAGGAADQVTLEADFDRAMSTLWMAYQPIVRATDGSIYGFEALLRTHDKVLPHPGAVIDAAERLGRVWELGRAVRERIAAEVSAGEPHIVVFVNLHPHDLMDPELFSKDAPLNKIAKRVVLEVTERATLDRVRDVTARIAELRGFGYRIAIDDLGAGYAGLASFAQLEPDLVKLDMSLVRGIGQSPVRRRLVASMVSLCADLGLMVVAEGIETESERDTLVALGCHLLQGFRFGRPAAPFSTAVW